MMSNPNPVGVFDSGVGGIGTLSALRRELPQEDFLYFGDTLHAPYGTKPREEVMACVTRVMTHLLANHVKAVVIACNTATSPRRNCGRRINCRYWAWNPRLSLPTPCATAEASWCWPRR